MRTFGVELEYNLSPYEVREKLEAVEALSKLDPICFENKLSDSDPVSCPESWTLKMEDHETIEITSPALIQEEELFLSLKRALPKFRAFWLKQGRKEYSKKEDEALIHFGNGLHVHIHCPELVREEEAEAWKCFSLAYLWSEVEHFFFQIQPKCRLDSCWCQPLKAKIQEKIREKGLPSQPSWTREQRQTLWGSCSFGKPRSLNFKTLKRYETVEVRIGISSFEARNITNWAILCRSTIERLVQAVEREEALPKFRDHKDFLSYIGLDRFKTWYQTRRNKMEGLSEQI